MPTTKLRAPEGFGALSIEGRAVDVGKDGSFHADHRDLATLRAHGFTDWDGGHGAIGDIDTMTKPQLIEVMLAKGRAELERMDVEQLREGLRRETEDSDETEPTAADIAEADKRLGEAPVTEERIATMTRPELFSFLRARNVAIGPATGDPGLRAAATNELRRQQSAT